MDRAVALAAVPSVAMDGANPEIERVLFDHISDAVFATDPDNRVTYWGASAARLFGYPAQDAVGRPFEELLPYRMAQPADEQAFFEELAAGRTWRGQGVVELPDGREMWLESSVQPIVEAGRVVGSVSVARDITATVDAQRSLAEQERFINAVLDVESALVIVLDAQGLVVRFNGACERLTGYRSADVVGHPAWALIPTSEIAEVQAVAAALQAGAFPSTNENHLVTRTGVKRLVRWDNTCLTDDSGRVTHVIATGIDVTEARRAEEAVRGIETVGHLLAEQGPVPLALDAVLGELESRLGYRFLALYLRDADGLRLGAQRGYANVPDRIPAARGIVGRVYRTGRPVLVADVGRDPDYVLGDAAVVGEIAVPLLGDGSILGVLNIESAEADGLTSGDLRVAAAVAERLSAALLRGAEQDALRDRVRLFAALSRFAVVANSILDPGRLAAALVDAVGSVVVSDTVLITTLDRRDGQFRVQAVRGIAEEAIGVVIQPGDGNTGRAIAERTVVESSHHPRAQYASALREYVWYDSMDGIAVPLIHEDTVLGVISVGRVGAGAAFSAAEHEVIALLGSQAALALANAFLVEEVSALAIHDGLTGLYNRRHFDAALDLAIARYKRKGNTGRLAAIMFDLDHFGQFNRLHGHLVGDAAIRLFAGILHERLRSADLVARYGGEEFVAILEDSSLEDALRVAEDVRRDLEGRAIPGTDPEAVHVTVSAGCAEIDPVDPTMVALIGRADAGLFMAKSAGRNRVVAA